MIRPADWHPADELTLEPNATRAVTELSRNVVVAAGPGAGKTELLAQRADHLLRTGACAYPRRILAISFKVDAARNLRERVRLRAGDQLAARFDSLTFHAFAKRLVDVFRRALTGRNALRSDYRIDTYDRVQGEQVTFDDLVPLALEILRVNEFAGGGLRQTYSHVFLDEFQDATGPQYELVKTAFAQSGAVLTAVGDVKQRIMVFAGALDGVLRTFATDFSADSLPLYQNFRSAPRLRRMQNSMIAEMDPAAVAPDDELSGEEGVVETFDFETAWDEGRAVADMIEGWLNDGVPPSEIAILVRQIPHLVAADLGHELTLRGIPFRNEQAHQDLSAEPAAALVLNFLRVISGDRQHGAYAELMRVVNRAVPSEEEAPRIDSRVKRQLHRARAAVRDPDFDSWENDAWKRLVDEFLELVTRPALLALSPGYRQGTWLDDVIEQTLAAFGEELGADGDATEALRRLSEVDAVRLLTIHKCKGLEFDKVVVLGVEEDLFWGDDAMSAFFVAISRAKRELVLTWTRYRPRPSGYSRKWNVARTRHRKFLEFADGF